MESGHESAGPSSGNHSGLAGSEEAREGCGCVFWVRARGIESMVRYIWVHRLLTRPCLTYQRSYRHSARVVHRIAQFH
jgi:hypothetical protein